MTAPRLFWHSGGHVVCARGTVVLARARDLARLCDEQGNGPAAVEEPRRAVYQVNADALREAVAAAEAWRRAAGWRRPDDVDHQSPRS